MTGIAVETAEAIVAASVPIDAAAADETPGITELAIESAELRMPGAARSKAERTPYWLFS